MPILRSLLMVLSALLMIGLLALDVFPSRLSQGMLMPTQAEGLQD